MDKLITLSKEDKSLQRYLLGDLDSKNRAIPIKVNFSTLGKEKWTFRIVQRTDLIRPSFSQLVFRLLRLDVLPLSLLPMMIYWLSFVEQSNFNMSRFVFAALAVVAFHIAVFLFNDYFDHMNGRDSLSERSAHKSIQLGWVSARQVFSLSILFSLVGGTLGIISMWGDYRAILLATGVVLLGVLGSSNRFFSLKNLGFAEVLTYLCFGPLLALGVSFSATSNVTLSTLLQGLFFGSFAGLYVMLRQLENIMADDKSRARTLAVRLGFDKFLHLVVGVYLGQLLFFSLGLVDLYGPLSLIGLVLPAIYTYLGVRHILKIKSPLSSMLNNLYLWSVYGILVYSMSLMVMGILFG